MSKLKNLLTRFAANVETQVDEIKAYASKRLNLQDPVQIVPYLGFGVGQRIYLKGRVLEQSGLHAPEEDDRWWENLVAMYKRFETDELPHVPVRLTVGGLTHETTTDEEGYYETWLELPEPLATGDLWRSATIALSAEVRPEQGRVESTGRFIVPPAHANFGVISDVDDTILKTHSTHIIKVARLTFLRNAHTRLPFEGVDAFYQALQTGQHNSPTNPIFYVSSSPWNLYDFLVDFLEIQDIPQGPLFLRDLGIDKNKLFHSGHHGHKLIQIERLLDAYTELPFILIGDSGQEDPEIYAEVVRRYPNRILAIYIRHVADEKRAQAVQTLQNEVEQAHSELVLVPDTEVAAEHAIKRGYITEDWLSKVHEAKLEDQSGSML